MNLGLTQGLVSAPLSKRDTKAGLGYAKWIPGFNKPFNIKSPFVATGNVLTITNPTSTAGGEFDAFAYSQNSGGGGTLTITGPGSGNSAVFKSNTTTVLATSNLGVNVGGASSINWGGTKQDIYGGVTDGIIRISNFAATGFTRLSLGPLTSSGVGLQVSGTALTIGLGDGAAGGSLTASGTFAVTSTSAFTGAITVTGGIVGTVAGGAATAGNVGEEIRATVAQGSAAALTTATPLTVTSISLTAGDWDITGIGCLTGASTGTSFDVAIGTTTNSFTGTVLGDTRLETPTVSVTGADASLMVPQFRVSISGTTTYYLIVQEVFTIGTPGAYGRISARRRR